jgi:DNA-binding transcriptional regulator LsrR (DeoR family)
MPKVKDPTKLSPRLKIIAMERASGLSQAAIGAKLGITHATVSEHLQKPAVQREIEALQAKTENQGVLTLAEKRATLAELIRSGTLNHANLAKFIELDAKLGGEIVLKTQGEIVLLNGDANRERLSEVARQAMLEASKVAGALPTADSTLRISGPVGNDETNLVIDV